MYFVHPQIKVNIKNLKDLTLSFFKSPDKKELEKIKSIFPQKEIVFTDMARTAFKLILEELNLRNSKIMVPAYICDVFFPIFKEYNISPVFLDIDKETFHINVNQIEQKITPKVRAILVCHTYGLPFNLKKIIPLTKKYNILIIEDCAHSFGAKINGVYTGNFGQASLFSLYKQFPCFRGGMAVLSKNPKIPLLKTNFNLRDFISLLNSFFLFALFFKTFGGNIAPKMIRKEKSKKPAKINQVSLNIFLNSQKEFEKDLKKRINLALIFRKELEKLGFNVQKSEDNVFCYVSALTPKKINRDKFVKQLKKHKIFPTRIWHTPIILNKKVQKEYNINLAEFPNTIESAERIVNFPLQNHYSKKDIEKMIKIIKKSC
jgi:dTDP-4-amino-4,6-dideoxygalactose transaminase